MLTNRTSLFFSAVLACTAVFGVACAVDTVDTTNNPSVSSAGAAGTSQGSAGNSAGGSTASGGSTSSGGSTATGGTTTGTGGTDTGTGGTAATGGTSATGGSTATGGTTGTGGTTAASAYVRLIHAVPDLPTVDVCLKPAGSDWADVKPFFNSIGSNGKFYYPSVSLFFEVDAGSWEVRVVPDGATDCGTAYTSWNDQPITFAEGGAHNLVVQGSTAEQVLSAKVHQQPASDAAAITYQAINAYTGTSKVDFGLIDADSMFTEVANGVTAYSTSVNGAVGTEHSLAPIFLETGTTTEVARGLPIAAKFGDSWLVLGAGTKLGDTNVDTQPQLILCYGLSSSNTAATGTTEIIDTANCCYGSNPEQPCFK